MLAILQDSIPYNQLEIRERKDVPPTYIIGDKLPERQEKVRKEEHNFDLEKVDFAEIFAKNKDKKKNKKKDIKKTEASFSSVNFISQY